MAKTISVEDWLAGLDALARADVEALREIVRWAEPSLGESIKWNAPSYDDGGHDRVTLGLNPRGGYRVVLHRGAETRDAAGFVFEDPDRLSKWPTADRGVITFADGAEIAAKAEALETLIRRWIAVTRE